MKKLKVYLETSIFNFFFSEKTPNEKDITIKLFAQIARYEAYISDITIAEIDRCPEPKRTKMFDLISEYDLQELTLNESAKELAAKYIQEGIIPQKYQADAFHIAIASVHGMDVVISWNFEHMVKLKTKREVVGINVFMGYKEIDIYSPLEVVENV